jgi:hypothetical protein
MQRPTLGRIVHYRGKQGLQTHRAAIVTADIGSLDQRGVDAGTIPALDSPLHAHLWVFTPAVSGGFTEYNVPPDDGAESDGQIKPGSWAWPPRT